MCVNCSGTSPACIVLSGSWQCGCNSNSQCSGGWCCNTLGNTHNLLLNTCVSPTSCAPTSPGVYDACENGGWVPAYTKNTPCCGGVGGVCGAGLTCNATGTCQ
jgi:hypothetical protein